ncbi:hypothetical protein H257_09494 [Aphanomyces astaci]|uniref:Secreted protein n=1 Tax=Aphanomyces astaci TaxID=112090 RepID=W4GBY9_APHAT|nr:hypothetical protein H257_09494 [Aphanomyces astaci]ETV76478.1 hypothetical protein H257_09494 [Aphanomyces astaci]|eukprot:XP_009834023.1 hypothetical protein H257_09494 [Aphanomyces astaci]
MAIFSRVLARFTWLLLWRFRQVVLQHRVGLVVTSLGLRGERDVFVVLDLDAGTGRWPELLLPQVLLFTQPTHPALQVAFRLGSQEVAAIRRLDDKAVEPVVARIEWTDRFNGQ